jgi:hypothetical protein
LTVNRQKDDPRNLDSPYDDATFGDDAMLMIDSKPNDSRVMVLHPKDGEVGYQRLRKFSSTESIEFAKIMKEQADFSSSGLSATLPTVSYEKSLSFPGLRLTINS